MQQDWKAAIAKYDDDVKNGVITFDDNGFAHDPYTDDPWIADNVAAHADPYL